ncbi:MAG: transcriptional regulator [Ignavibacteriales bacterium]|nr:hypothetical protein [Ignavibacteriaceae bacterium]MCK6613648.1 hypothetical protein [Ignavibacteriaceae bacterium]QOJ27458.1 MAG: transcriptional regulator [Ignavibacteriales bacterium]
MQKVKRFEIITPDAALKELMRSFRERNITGYSVIPDVTGSGDRGSQSGDDLSGISKNVLIITTTEPGREHELEEAIRPILKRYGGVCMVTDALWLKH